MHEGSMAVTSASFRDIHTVIQQYQGRQAHLAALRQVLLGLQPEGTMFTF
ncbi:MAG: hypothetical protein JOY83_27290 [Alphaproteobacteria bacterium]|nr:hypothetical protein [Alphaproteobacteria bacterium]